MASTLSPQIAPPRQVVICNHKTCHQQGSTALQQAFQAALPEGISLQVRNCLGQCGNGPIVLILPEEIWYSHVRPEDVPKIVEQHLNRGNPVREKLYREFHSEQVVQPQRPWGWVMVGCSAIVMVGLLGLGIFWAWSHAPV